MQMKVRLGFDGAVLSFDCGKRGVIDRVFFLSIPHSGALVKYYI